MEKTSALIITFNPADSLARKLDSLYKEFNQIILVDNGSETEIKNLIKTQVQIRGRRLHAIFNEDNLGIASALNQGFSLAIQLGYEYLVTLDQDSNPMVGMKKALLTAHSVHPNRDNLAILAPDIIETALSARTRYIRPKYHFLFERVICQDEMLRNVSFVITSGAMYNLNLYKRIGPFRDDFFIDAVDKEYCLRAISKGYEIAIACNAHLEHHLGNRQQKSFFGSIHYPTFHLPFRWYYMSRNRIAMLRLYGWRFPHWFFHELGISLKSLAQMLLFENHRKLKMKALVYGTWDGIKGKMGKMPTKIKTRLTKST